MIEMSKGLSLGRNKGRFQFFGRRGRFVHKGIRNYSCILCAFGGIFCAKAQSFSLVKGEPTFSWNYSSSPPFFLAATEAEKKTSQTRTTKTKEYYGLLCASVTRSFAQRCNYYTGYNSKLTSFLSVLVLNEKWIIQQQARVITSFLSVNIVKNLLKPPKWSNSSKQHDTKRKKSEGEKKKKTKKEERNKNDGSSLKLNKSLLLLLLVFCLDLIVFLKNHLRNL